MPANATPAPLPLPKNPRHQRFADGVIAGKTLVEAYLEAGFKCSRATATANAKKLRRARDVAAYIRAAQESMAEDVLLSVREILIFCARVVRAKIGTITPEGPDGDLIKTFSKNETEMGTTLRVEKHDPFKAIEIHLKMTGNDPAADALGKLTEALAALAPSSPLPTGKL